MARTPIHPGEHLKEELATLGLSASELARQIGVPPNRITSIVNCERAMTADTAVRLAHWFGTSAEFWLNLQKLYDLRIAERELARILPKLKRLNRPALPARAARKTVAMS